MADLDETLPLSGIRVVDFTWIVAGPQATRILADLGAEVIRVENESYMDSLRMGTQADPDNPSPNRSGIFNNFNRNKLGITANLHHPRGRELVERLIAVSDVVVENYSAGAFARMGFGMERLRELNPEIIYLSLSGFGHHGRDSQHITWGPTAQAVSGATAMSGLPDREPAGWGFSYLDHSAGYYGAIAILLALRHRTRGGGGQYIDLSQVECGMTLGGVPMLDYQVNGRHYEQIGNRSRYPAIAPHNTYRCAGDDRWIAIVAETDDQWREVREELAAPELASARFATNGGRLAEQDELDALITSCTCERDPHELMYALQARGVPAGAVQTAADKMEQDEQLRERGFYPVAPSGDLPEHRFEGLPMRFSRSRWEVRRGAPLLGGDTDDVLIRILGYSEDEIAALRAEAAV